MLENGARETRTFVTVQVVDPKKLLIALSQKVFIRHQPSPLLGIMHNIPNPIL